LAISEARRQAIASGDSAALAALPPVMATSVPSPKKSQPPSKQAKADYPLAPLGPGEEYYVVEPENTLYSIARQYGMKADALKALNGLKDITLQIGQRLRVMRAPDVQVDATQYAVKEGDTMFSIAQKFGLTVEELRSLNNLDSNMLFERMVLKVKKP
jgi:LysM repeat protein